MTWIDSHCHLDADAFKDDLPDVLNHAKQQAITQFVVPSVGASSWQRQQSIQQAHPQTFHAFGIHPWYCDQHQESDLDMLNDLLPHAVAVGECGLDLMPNRPALNRQLWWLKAQLKLAAQHQLPVIIHAVKSADLVLQCLKVYPQLSGVIHGFYGSLQQAESFIKITQHLFCKFSSVLIFLYKITSHLLQIPPRTSHK